MTSKLSKVFEKIAKMVLILLFATACSCPYKYAYKASQAEKRHLETLKKEERRVKHD